MNKRCVFILPYFGQFNNYFPLFLKSCGKNDMYDWFVFTDNEEVYDYPANVKVFKTSLAEIKKNAEKKFGFEVCLSTPYKLCDYKPAYGFLFEEYLTGYKYWGHCDCDLILGNLNEMLTPLLEKGYDKLFAAGHMTVYKNNVDNNRRFMKAYKGKSLYKEAFTTDEIYVFDEDVEGDNIHRIFLEDGAKVFQDDISMNATSHFARIRRSCYNTDEHKFKWEPFKSARYYWKDGNIIEAEYDCDTGSVKQTKYLYMHLQMRKMRLGKNVLQTEQFQILPDRFVTAKRIPATKKDMHLLTIKLPYFYWLDVYKKKVRKKLNKAGK